MEEYTPHQNFEDLKGYYTYSDALIPCAGLYCPAQKGDQLECGRVTMLARQSSDSAIFDEVCLSPYVCGHDSFLEEDGTKLEMTCKSGAYKMAAAIFAAAAALQLAM